MRRLLGTTKTGIAALIARFGRDQRGQIAIIFGLSITMLVVGAGASVDLARSYIARQKLSQVAELTCQYSVRPSVVDLANTTYSGTNGLQAYLATVNGFAGKALSGQNWGTTAVTDPNNTTNYFSATAASGVNTSTTGTAPTNPVVELKASIPTMFMQIVKVTTIPVHAKINCLTASNTPPIDNTPAPSGGTNFPFQEGFETSCATFCFTKPDGTPGTISSPTSATPSSPSYTGKTGQPWYVLGYCMEVDNIGTINSSTPEGTHSVELDCDNGSGSVSSDHGNSSLTTKTYLAAGNYELRYNYRSRVDYPSYDPAYICGTTAADVGWANDPTPFYANAVRTNQMNVYLDLATSSTIPLHTTIDGTQQLGGTNLIDVCVYSFNWVERSVKIDVTTPGFYWVSFAADGTSDAQGAQLDNIRLCQKTCLTPLQDNFPTVWLAANNGGVNKVLFEDTFENPDHSHDSCMSSARYPCGNLANSKGLTVSSTCSSPPGPVPLGYPCQTPTGWAVAPYNEVVYWETGAPQGSQYISLQGSNAYSNSSDPLNRSISRSFLLDPGYYNVSYQYMSLMDFSYDFVFSGGYFPVCTAAPPSYDYTSWYSLFGKKNGRDYGDNSIYQQYISTDFMNVFVANGQLVSTPIINSTIGGAPTYNNPDGTISASPTVPLDNGSNFVNYSAAAKNPVIDSCYYSSNFVPVSRSINIKVTKPGLYWLTFSAQGNPTTGLGASPGAGPGLDDVKLTALGSYTMGLMGNPPVPTATVPIATANATPMPIPVSTPQPDSVYYGLNSTYNGFTIIADPFQPPSAN